MWMRSFWSVSLTSLVATIRPVAQHRHPVGEQEHLLEPVADVDDGDAAVPQQPDDIEQPLDIVLGQRRGRLVHDQDAGIVGKRLGDLDPLAIADATASRRRR